MVTLKELLADWSDFDAAAHSLAQVLGIIPQGVPMRAHKNVYWSNNSLGNMLHEQLEKLASEGILEKREEPDSQYRWRSTYHWNGSA